MSEVISMDTSEPAEVIVMNEDSDMSDFDLSEDELDGELSLSDLASGSDDDAPTRLPGGWGPAGRQPVANAFLGRQGPSSACCPTDVESPLDYFLLFFTTEVIEKLALETNRYAAQSLRTQPSSPSKMRPWEEVDESDLRKFMGLVMLMGFTQRNGNMESYWSKDTVLATPIFPQVMSRCRFQQIQRYLHFNNNDDLPANREDKLYKIRPVYDLLSERWRSMYDLGEFISIDEGMVKWRGRLSFRVYNKDKPIKYGIKSYILADSRSKYCWNIDMYHGVSKTLIETVTGLLTPQCMSRWHTLYMDNFYNSLAMSEHLLDRQVHTVGTLGRHRGEPREIREPGNGNGNALFMHLQWGNGNDVFMQV